MEVARRRNMWWWSNSISRRNESMYLIARSWPTWLCVLIVGRNNFTIEVDALSRWNSSTIIGSEDVNIDTVGLVVLGLIVLCLIGVLRLLLWCAWILNLLGCSRSESYGLCVLQRDTSFTAFTWKCCWNRVRTAVGNGTSTRIAVRIWSEGMRVKRTFLFVWVDLPL